MRGTYTGDVEDAEYPGNGHGDPGYSDGIEASIAPDHNECMHRYCLKQNDMFHIDKRGN